MSNTKIINNVAMSSLKPHAKNPRKNEATIDKVAQSISLYGYRSPIVIDQSNTILAGHTRYEALKVLGYTEIPFVVQATGTDAENERFLLADNKTSEFSDWDYKALTAFDVETLQTVGFSDSEVSKILAESKIGEEKEEEEKTAEQRDINYGDVFLCQGASATHRVVFGEWNNAAHVDSLKIDGDRMLICAPYATENSLRDDAKLFKTFVSVCADRASGSPVALLAPISECTGIGAAFSFDGLANTFRSFGYTCSCSKIVVKNDKTTALGVGVAAKGDVLTVFVRSEINDEMVRPLWVDYPVWFNVGKKGQMPYSLELYRRILVMMSKQKSCVVDLMCDNGASLGCSELYGRKFCGVCGDKSALVSMLTNFEATFSRHVVRESDGNRIGEL